MVSQTSIGLGNRHATNIAFSRNLADLGSFKQSLSVEAGTQQFSQDAAKLNRAHLLYLAAADLNMGKVHFDLDITALRQHPYSPHPVEDGALSSRFPLDANTNPRDVKATENRIQFNAGIDQALSIGKWVTLISLGRSENRNTRGYLRADFAVDGITWLDREVTVINGVRFIGSTLWTDFEALSQ